jgi:hypothetical protein
MVRSTVRNPSKGTRWNFRSGAQGGISSKDPKEENLVRSTWKSVW